jgi:PPOX class probable F420-dependent enzyme
MTWEVIVGRDATDRGAAERNTGRPGPVRPGMELTTAVEFARAHRQSVLTTIRRDGRPQLSNVLHHVGDDGVARVSITADRAKYHNLVRTPWAALHVTQDDFYAYVVLEGAADVAPVAAAPDDATVEELVALYRSLLGEHPEWDDYRAAMVADRRTVVRLTPDRAYGMLRLPTPD